MDGPNCTNFRKSCIFCGQHQALARCGGTWPEPAHANSTSLHGCFTRLATARRRFQTVNSNDQPYQKLQYVDLPITLYNGSRNKRKGSAHQQGWPSGASTSKRRRPPSHEQVLAPNALMISESSRLDSAQCCVNMPSPCFQLDAIFLRSFLRRLRSLVSHK